MYVAQFLSSHIHVFLDITAYQEDDIWLIYGDRNKIRVD